MKKEISWMSGKGPVVVTVELVTKREISCDGDKETVDCCEMVISAQAPCSTLGGIVRKEIMVGNVKVAATMGKLAIVPENLDKIDAAIAEIKATPEWKAKEARIAKNAEESKEYEAHRARMAKVMGY